MGHEEPLGVARGKAVASAGGRAEHRSFAADRIKGPNRFGRFDKVSLDEIKPLPVVERHRAYVAKSAVDHLGRRGSAIGAGQAGDGAVAIRPFSSPGERDATDVRRATETLYFRNHGLIADTGHSRDLRRRPAIRPFADIRTGVLHRLSR